MDQHKRVVFWFTGLSASGKTTLSKCLRAYLKIMKVRSYGIDGDEIRKTICSDLGYSDESAIENCRRVSHLCNILLDTDTVPVVSLISPKREIRQRAKEIIDARFVEVYVKCPITTCQERDPKGLYKKYSEGKIPNFIGITCPYEEPENPDLILNTNELSLSNCTSLLLDYWKTL